jgi:glycosyltransferase involved in cell wall biosynthesis
LQQEEMLKIVLINDYGYPVGGAERYFFKLQQGFSRKGCQVITISSDSIAHRSSLLNGFDTDYQLPHTGNFFNLDSVFSLKNYYYLKKILKKIKPDIVHIQNCIYALSPSVIFAAYSYPMVVTLHDYSSICIGDKRTFKGEICREQFCNCCGRGKKFFSRDSLEVYKRKVLQQALKRATKIAPSEYLKREFLKNGVIEIEVVPHPCEDSLVRISPASQRKKNFLFLGRLVEQKGVEVLVRAFAKISSKNPESKLLIAGHGQLESKLKYLASSLGIDEQVVFYGWVDKVKRTKLFQESLVLMLPSIWPEVAGLSLYEAASCGLPAIASSVGGIPEFIIHNENGFLVPHADVDSLALQMQAVLDNPGMLDLFSEKLILKTKEQSLEAHLSHLEQIYRLASAK